MQTNESFQMDQNTHTHTHTHTPTSGRDADAIPSASSQQQHPALLKHGNLKKDEKTKER